MAASTLKITAVAVLLPLLAWAFLPSFSCGRGHMMAAKQGAMLHLIERLTQATKLYYCDHDSYPPGDGSGTASLVSALSALGPKRIPYFEFRPDMLDGSGNVQSILRPGVDFLRYRNNEKGGGHNSGSFDLWCPDRHATPDGLNNWSP